MNAQGYPDEDEGGQDFKEAEILQMKTGLKSYSCKLAFTNQKKCNIMVKATLVIPFMHKII